MNRETMDLFADAEPQTAAPMQPCCTEHPTSVPKLEDVMVASGRKAAFKAMTPAEHRELEDAVSVVSRAKRSAYDRASAGEFLSAFGWLAHQPTLAAASAALSRVFIDLGAIPMAGTHVAV
jgi:hypothetical protein